MAFTLFKRRNVTTPSETEAAGQGFVPPVPPGAQPLKRPGQMTQEEEARVYHAGPSVIDFLPWVEYLDEAQCLLLDDGMSVGAVYDVTPAATEGRTDERLEQIRDMVEDALQDSFDEYDTHPWVVQFFC